MKMHTDNGFTFDIKEDHATVMEIDGDPQIVEIPEQIDGVPVTELAEYLFPGKLSGHTDSPGSQENRPLRFL